MKKVLILVFGSIEEEKSVFERIRDAITMVFSISVEYHSKVEVPVSDFNQKRNQYHSSSFLKVVAEETREGLGLGVTDLDLYSDNLNFVFGQASPMIHSAVISLYRLRPSFYGEEDKTLFLERLRKEAVHEIGHVLGLSHCDSPSCVMYFSNSILEVDRKGIELCEHCRERLKSIY